jgi:hypothetical protein
MVIVSFPASQTISVFRVDRPARQSSRPPSGHPSSRGSAETMRRSGSPIASRNARQRGAAGAITVNW